MKCPTCEHNGDETINADFVAPFLRLQIARDELKQHLLSPHDRVANVTRSVRLHNHNLHTDARQGVE